LCVRVYEEIVQGGTPFEKGIQVDPRIGRKGSLCYVIDCKFVMI